MLTVHRLLEAPRGEETKEHWIGPAPWIVTAPPGPNALRAEVRSRRLNPPHAARAYPLVIRRAQGSIVEDVDGNRYLDFTCGTDVCTGHCHPSVLRAIETQMRKSTFRWESAIHQDPTASVAERLIDHTPDSDGRTIIFTDTSREAAELARRLACDYTHGDRILQCRPESMTDRFFTQAAQPDQVAAVFVCPTGDRDGCSLAPSGFLEHLRLWCDEQGALLVVDESELGLGRSGRVFCCEALGLVPDLLVIGRGLAGGMPLGAVVARATVVENTDARPAAGSGGHPISHAAALATIEAIESHLLSHASELHPVAMRKLEAISGRHKCVCSPRGLGLVLAVDIVSDKRSRRPAPELRDRILSEAFGLGLLLAGTGESGIRLNPPLCINRVQLEIGFDVFEEVVATVSE